MIANRPQTIKTARLCLGPITDRDAGGVTALLTNDEICKTFIVPDFSSREEERRMFETLKGLSASSDHFVYGIYLENNIIGFINDVEIQGREIELGFVIHPSQKNQGFATEVLMASIQALFDLGYCVVKTGAFQENAPSIRVMEKCAMVRQPQITQIEYRGKIHPCVWFEKRNESTR